MKSDGNIVLCCDGIRNLKRTHLKTNETKAVCVWMDITVLY